MRKLISSGSTFEAAIGYSRAVVDGDWMFVSGTTGFDYATMKISDDVAEQADQTFRNIKAAMEQGGFQLADIVRVHYLLPDAADFEDGWLQVLLFLPWRQRKTSLLVGRARQVKSVGI